MINCMSMGGWGWVAGAIENKAISWCSLKDMLKSYLKSSEVVFELLFEVVLV